MRFLIDVSAVSRSLHDALISWGHDVLSAVNIHPASRDETLLAIAASERRIVITEDKDFGELIFKRRLPHHGVIRLKEMDDEEKIAAMRDLIREHFDFLMSGEAMVVIGPDRKPRLSRAPSRAANLQPPPGNG